jgi:transcriptional regulator with XRE-family HTH domain
MNFAEKLKTLMKLRGLNQGELSRLCGVSQNAVSKWLSGKAEPSISNTIAVARALGVTVADLIDEDPQCRGLKPADRKLLALPEEQKDLVIKFFEFLKTCPKIGD